jgi:hypothetical protein
LIERFVMSVPHDGHRSSHSANSESEATPMSGTSSRA